MLLPSHMGGNMTIQERLLLSGRAAGLQIAEVCHRKPEASLLPRYPRGLARRVARGSRPISALAFFGQRNIGAKGRASRLVFRNRVFNPLLERNGWDQIRPL
jgi:hypothetical protein